MLVELVVVVFLTLVRVNGCMNVLNTEDNCVDNFGTKKGTEGTGVSLYQPSTTGMLISTHPTAAGQTINTGTIATFCSRTGSS